jgi:hypothetical protein
MSLYLPASTLPLSGAKLKDDDCVDEFYRQLYELTVVYEWSPDSFSRSGFYGSGKSLVV